MSTDTEIVYRIQHRDTGLWLLLEYCREGWADDFTVMPSWVAPERWSFGFDTLEFVRRVVREMHLSPDKYAIRKRVPLQDDLATR